jgi:hypothetical protein
MALSAASAKSRGIWLNSANVRLPRPRVKDCKDNIKYIYFDIQASETEKIEIVSKINNVEVKREVVQLKVWDRDGKSRAFWAPATGINVGSNNFVIETGREGCDPDWISEPYEVYAC